MGWVILLLIIIICFGLFKKSNQRLTPKKAKEIKEAKKVLWIKYLELKNKPIEEKMNIVKITSKFITGFSHSQRTILRFAYRKIIDWKMLDEYIPGKEPFIKMSGTEFYDTYAENAIKLKKRVWIKYEDHNCNITERKVDIYFSKYGDFHGWDYLRNEARTFKIDRVREWKILDETYEWDKNIAAYLEQEKTRGITSKKSYPEWLQEQIKK